MFVVDTHATGTCDYDTLARPAFLYTENNYSDVFDVNGKYFNRIFIKRYAWQYLINAMITVFMFVSNT